MKLLLPNITAQTLLLLVSHIKLAVETLSVLISVVAAIRYRRRAQADVDCLVSLSLTPKAGGKMQPQLSHRHNIDMVKFHSGRDPTRDQTPPTPSS